jgi:chemotaxis protein MotB
MSNDRHPRPRIIVKRRHEHEDEGHGGQWKVAYADFVTAMMAFFMVLWIVSSTNATQRQGIARFFNRTLSLDLQGGDGLLDGGKSMVVGAGPAKRAVGREESTQGAEGNGARGVDAMPTRLDRQRLEAIKAEIERMMRTGDLRDAARHLLIEMTPEGLRIQIFDRDGEAMFDLGSAVPSPRLVHILGILAGVLATVPNPMVMAGHTDALPLQAPDYTNWELSADRANAARRTLEGDGLTSARFVRVEGLAATDLLVPQTPDDPRNRRIAVTLLRRPPPAAQ